MSGWGALLAVLALGAAEAEPRVMPEGWRPPTDREIARSRARNAQELNLSQSTQRFSVTGDFDADALPDEAMILYNDRTLKFAVFLDRGAGGPVVRLSERMPLDLVWNHGLFVTPAGTYPTACSKGIGETAGCEPQVTLRSPGISLMTYEAGVETFYWTDDGFRTATLSD